MGFGYVQIVFYLFLFCSFSSAQKQYSIKFNDKEIKLDGVLNEQHWKDAEIASGFTVNSPIYGNPSRFSSEVRLYYDSEAIYVGGILKDPFPDSISFSLSQRDQTGNADWVGVSIDPYGNSVNAFRFVVTSAGVEIDGLESINDIDYLWNSVWRSATARHTDGWSFEMKIPFQFGLEFLYF